MKEMEGIEIITEKQIKETENRDTDQRDVISNATQEDQGNMEIDPKKTKGEEEEQVMARLLQEWKRLDEWYNFKVVPSDKDVHVLITIDEKTYEGGNDGDYHPMSWYHSYDGGRAFYTALGHTDESYSDPLYLGHLLGGIKYAMGQSK